MANKEKLFTEFTAPTKQEWLDKIEVDLKGADFQKRLVWRTNEGFNVQPFYRREDLANLKTPDALPGEFPFVRGNKKDSNEWYVRQNIVVDDPKAANAKALDILNKGIDSLGFRLPGKLVSKETVEALLEGIYCDIIEVNFATCPRHSVELAEILVEFFQKKGYDKEFEMYRLGFPNLEVERGFTRFLIPYYTTLKSDQGQFFVANFVKELRTGKVEAFMKRLESLFADGDYQVVGKAELYFQNVVWVIFKMIGFYTEVERHTSDGRMDMFIKTADYIYILEFKLDKSAEEALQQIEDKQYVKPFEHDGRTLYEIGINFSTSTKRIDGWKVKANMA